MANFKAVNSAIQAKFGTGIEVVRGKDYVYFNGKNWGEVESIMCPPVTTSTEDLIRLCFDEIENYIHSDLESELTYELFKEKYNFLLKELLSYSCDEAGSWYFSDQLASFVDAHPQFEEMLDNEAV